MTAVSYAAILDSAFPAITSSCVDEGQNLHGWVGYYWTSKAPRKNWESTNVVCTVLQQAHSGNDSTLIIVRDTDLSLNSLGKKVCQKLTRR
jgi:hypothetical protein